MLIHEWDAVFRNHKDDEELMDDVIPNEEVLGEFVRAVKSDGWKKVMCRRQRIMMARFCLWESAMTSKRRNTNV